jgi:hypothetical protein
MSPLMCLLFFLVLTPMGIAMAGISWPMVGETAGPAHRALGVLVAATGVLIALGGLGFLGMAAQRLVG